jgi:hypothetical protein
MRPC